MKMHCGNSHSMFPFATQPDNADATIQDLLDWIERNKIPRASGASAAPNRQFIPFKELQAYLKSSKRAKKLLTAFITEHDDPVDIDLLLEDYVRVFTILICISKGTYIKHFMYHTLCDQDLPLKTMPKYFPKDPDDPKFWERFYDMQFTFCAHRLQSKKINKINIDEHCILPFVRKEMIDSGGSAAIYKIDLHPDYDGLQNNEGHIKVSHMLQSCMTLQ